MKRTTLFIVFVCAWNAAQGQAASLELPRLIRAPTASSVPAGRVDFRYDLIRDPGIFPATDHWQNFTLGFGFFSRLTLTARATIAEDSVTGEDVARDLAASMQLQLLSETRWRPSVAAGLQDVGGAASNFRARYVTATKTVLGRVRGTVGYGIGPDILDGAFGGGEIVLHPALSVLGEFDADAFNAAIRLSPMPQRWIDRGIPRPSIDVVFQHDRPVSLAVGMRGSLGHFPDSAKKALANHTLRRLEVSPTENRSVAKLTEDLQGELISRGLENVRVAIGLIDSRQTISIEYENRTFNRNEMDAVGLVLGLAATRTSPAVSDIRVVVKQVNVPVLEVRTGAAAFVSFVNGEMSSAQFSEQLGVSQTARAIKGDDAAGPVTSVGASSRFHVDVFVHPRVETTLLTEWGAADARFSLLPEAEIPLFRGTSVDVRGLVPIGRTANYPGVVGDPVLDRALLLHAFRVPAGGNAAGFIAQGAVGRYDPVRVGAGGELAASLAGGILRAKATVVRLGTTFGDLNTWVTVLDARVKVTPLDASFTASAGRFLDGDKGYRVDGSRFFGNAELGFFARHSDHGTLAGARIALPLTFNRDVRPLYVRPRLPDLYSYEHRSVILADRNVIRNDIGRLPVTDHEVERRFWDRDRLNAVYFVRHVELLRQAVLNFIDVN